MKITDLQGMSRREVRRSSPASIAISTMIRLRRAVYANVSAKFGKPSSARSNSRSARTPALRRERPTTPIFSRTPAKASAIALIRLSIAGRYRTSSSRTTPAGLSRNQTSVLQRAEMTSTNHRLKVSVAIGEQVNLGGTSRAVKIGGPSRLKPGLRSRASQRRPRDDTSPNGRPDSTLPPSQPRGRTWAPVVGDLGAEGRRHNQPASTHTQPRPGTRPTDPPRSPGVPFSATRRLLST